MNSFERLFASGEPGGLFTALSDDMQTALQFVSRQQLLLNALLPNAPTICAAPRPAGSTPGGGGGGGGGAGGASRPPAGGGRSSSDSASESVSESSNNPGGSPSESESDITSLSRGPTA